MSTPTVEPQETDPGQEPVGESGDQEETPSQEPEATEPEGGDEDEPATGLEGEALQKELDRARKEAKRYRLERNELRDKLAAAKTVEDYEALEAALATKDRELALAKYEEKLPADALALLADLDTPDAIKAKGDVLVNLLSTKGRSAPDADALGGGLDPRDTGDDGKTVDDIYDEIISRRNGIR